MREIERKFLLSQPLSTVLDNEHTSLEITQHYLAKTGEWTVRARRQDDQYFLTLKKRESTTTCREIETEVTRDHYEALEELSSWSLSKTRHVIIHEGKKWEIDEFSHGLVVAEIELKDENEVFVRPTWLGEEVTKDRSYSSKRIAKSLTR